MNTQRIVVSLLGLSACLALAAHSIATSQPDQKQTAIMPATREAVALPRSSLTLAGASQAVEAARAFASTRAGTGAIAVVDDGGHVLLLTRLDGTFPAAADVATGKARTAATFCKPTRQFEESIKGGRLALLGVAAMTPLQGGVPIIIDGCVVGAIGVSGAASAQEDEEIAVAGASSFSTARSPDQAAR